MEDKTAMMLEPDPVTFLGLEADREISRVNPLAVSPRILHLLLPGIQV